MQDSIFTKIIKGEIPCHKVYEDDKTLAFLDIHPLQPGHTLVISKAQVEFAWDLSDDDYAAVTSTAKKVALRLRDVMKRPYVGGMIVGTDVPHTHVHLVPFDDPAQMHEKQDLDKKPDDRALAELAAKIVF